MRTKGIKLAFSLPLLGITLNAYSSINPSHLKLQPITDPLVTLPMNENGTVKYLLSNDGNNAYHLQLSPSQGLYQQTNESEDCSTDINLLPGKSCVLSLSIDGSQAISLTKKGPVVCEKGWKWSDEAGFSAHACLQPKPDKRMSINFSSSGQATLSIKINPETSQNSHSTMKQCFASMAGCVLTLFQNSTTQKSIVLTNTSNIVGKDIQAYGLPAGVTQNASSCKTLNPNSSCTISFKAGSTRTLGKSVTIKGSNTASSTITMKVLGIGDPFAGGIIACMGGGLQNLIATSTDVSLATPWGGFDKTTLANSTTDGQTNTTLIVNVLGDDGGNAYGAKVCDDLVVGSYNNWFLPTKDQLICLFINSITDRSVNYWSSSESANPQDAPIFAVTLLTTGETVLNSKDLDAAIRCVSTFNP